MLCGTVCLVVLASFVAALFYPPNTVSETFRAEMFKLLIFMLGVVSGWLLAARNGAMPPKQ
jgi:hypothetical protein